jgi:hypothetical protein
VLVVVACVERHTVSELNDSKSVIMLEALFVCTQVANEVRGLLWLDGSVVRGGTTTLTAKRQRPYDGDIVYPSMLYAGESFETALKV